MIIFQQNVSVKMHYEEVGSIIQNSIVKICALQNEELRMPELQDNFNLGYQLQN